MMDPAQKKKMARTAFWAAAIPVAMLGMAFAAVPLYDLFCRVTGFGGTTQVATGGPGRVLERQVEVRFDANHPPDVPVEFKAEKRAISLRLGDSGLAFYTLTNLSKEPITLKATYNVAPHKSAIYFQKIQCFCFEDMTVQPGEALKLPVIFFVSPELAEDIDTREVQEITLSYTFYLSRDFDRLAKAPWEAEAGS
jgi:cytochrome c oxidase assembly protein subunit 11